MQQSLRHSLHFKIIFRSREKILTPLQNTDVIISSIGSKALSRLQLRLKNCCGQILLLCAVFTPSMRGSPTHESEV